MIVAHFFIDDNLYYYSFKIKGHAQYDALGKDIVCAAVSSAVQLTINLIAQSLTQKLNITTNKEEALIELMIDSVNRKKVSLFIKSLHDHLLEISIKYPENLLSSLIKKNKNIGS